MYENDLIKTAERLNQEALAEEMAEAVLIANLPRSKATNAYELCEEVCQAILEEPRRYNQSDWMMHGTFKMSRYFLQHQENAPNCGTVACFAGWIVTLRGNLILDITEISRQAAQLLGFSYYLGRIADDKEREEIFQTEVLPIRRLFDDDLIQYTDDDLLPNIGTLEYAQLGVKKLRTFMATYEVRLKAKAL